MKWWIVALLVLAAAAGLFLWARRNGGKLIASIVEWVRPDQRTLWLAIPSDPGSVMAISESGQPVLVKLPEGTTSAMVTAVGVSGGKYVASILHDIPDRRGSPRT